MLLFLDKFDRRNKDKEGKFAKFWYQRKFLSKFIVPFVSATNFELVRMCYGDIFWMIEFDKNRPAPPNVVLRKKLYLTEYSFLLRMTMCSILRMTLRSCTASSSFLSPPSLIASSAVLSMPLISFIALRKENKQWVEKGRRMKQRSRERVKRMSMSSLLRWPKCRNTKNATKKIWQTQ